MHSSETSCILDSGSPQNHQTTRNLTRNEQGRSGPVFEAYPAELRPVLTKHRLRRRRHRNAASVLTGAALALGISALRPVPASATTPSHPASFASTTNPAPSTPAQEKIATPAHPTQSAPINSRHPTPRHAAPAPNRHATESLHTQLPDSPIRRPAPDESTRTPSQPGRHARPPEPPTGCPPSAYLDGMTSPHTDLPPPNP